VRTRASCPDTASLLLRLWVCANEQYGRQSGMLRVWRLLRAPSGTGTPRPTTLPARASASTMMLFSSLTPRISMWVTTSWWARRRVRRGTAYVMSRTPLATLRIGACRSRPWSAHRGHRLSGLHHEGDVGAQECARRLSRAAPRAAGGVAADAAWRGYTSNGWDRPRGLGGRRASRRSGGGVTSRPW